MSNFHPCIFIICVFKEIDPLPPIDHSDIDYEKFSKNFYEEPVDITKLSEDEVTALRSKLDIRVGFIVSQDLKISKIFQDCIKDQDP